MTKEEMSEYQKAYRARIKADPVLYEKFKEKRRIYGRERYRSNEEVRNNAKTLSSRRYAEIMSDPEKHKLQLLKRVREYKNNDEARERIKKASLERYHRLHPNAKYRLA